MTDRQQITRSTGILGAATGLSRIGGLVRDVVVAGLFGAGFATDAFFMAFTIPNLLRRFFAEGSLTAAFVPTYSEIYHLQGEDEARRVANICWTLLTLVMAVVVAAGIFASPWLVGAIGHGFAATPGKLALTDMLNRLMFPYIFFVSLLALATGILNVRGHFFLPAVSPLVLNLSMITSGLLFSGWCDPPILSLAFGVILGGLLQLLMQIPVLRRHRQLPKPDFHFFDPAVRKITRLMIPGLFGVAIYQVNVIITRLLASFLPEGSVSYLYYGQRLFEFPQGIFIVSLAQAVLPTLSRQAAENDRPALAESVRFALMLMLVGILPATVGLILCAEPVYSLFFMRGQFGSNAVHQSALALAAYAPGLLCVGFSRVLAPTFYALKDTRTPVLISFWTLLINVGLGLLLMGPMRHVGLALALSVASLFNALLLGGVLLRRLPELNLRPMLPALMKLIVPVMVMGLAVWSILGSVDWLQPGNLLHKGVVLTLAVTAGLLLYGGGCLLFRVEGADRVGEIIRRKLFRGKG
ncbi:murein biosynthesis integral membrane protein MurJ [Geothermobacter hydrogeniphilus]|uniref:Probable lipid II flippase MurJ n=1 Tax=Geothermobacter hydrogeniphilus TaxID=1969733 RepID=A0A1X0YE26_9BACT|nr:murein biosynthesis integral membrane protein MurJ [Geothermobacter hydrogeniphilus]ORJ63352.1 murein biosynthesis integral membrane protein MurJ [Geothermobacter hydrogeniphilus]